MANLMVLFNLPRTLSGCHGNKIWDKIGYNSVCVRDICEIFASIGRGFRGWAIECCQSHFPRSTPVAMANNLGQNWL